MPISRLNERNAHTKRWLARAQREALRTRAQFKARDTMFERLGILFPEMEVKSEVAPRRVKTGKMKRVALVYRELKQSAKFL
jgi:hypothetical protein